MQTTMAKLTADVNVADAFRLLKTGVPIYIAPAPEATDEIRLREAWKDNNGDIHYDYSAVYLDKDTALQVARAFNQDSILALRLAKRGKGKAYLLRDTIHNRVMTLLHAGGYTADGNFLLTATDGFLPLVAVDVAPVKIDFLSTR
jgi:hypothetical protein